MRTLLIKNIQSLFQVRADDELVRGAAMDYIPYLEQAYLWIEGDRIVALGTMSELAGKTLPKEQLDATGRLVVPTWCDSHTHLVFQGSREREFVQKIQGVSYANIAREGGGILHTAQRVQQASEEELYQAAWERLAQLSAWGTGAVEIKSGYGLTPEAEIKMLRVIRRLKENSRLRIKATFLGAHAYPQAFRDNHEGYLRSIEEEMLPVIAREGLADYIDVFCEEGFFSPRETARLLTAGQKFGLKAKLHANQLHVSGGVQVGVDHGAVSVDHLESIGPAEIAYLQESATIPTLLPTAALFLRLPLPPARDMLAAGLPLALATDYNPGSSPSGNMPLLLALSCSQMRMTPAEVVNAATLNGAHAMEVADELGSFRPGKLANLILTKPMPSLAYWFYAFGEDHIERVMLRGEWVR